MKCEYCGIDDSITKIINSKWGFLCRKHYLQKYKHGDFTKVTIYDDNSYEVINNYVKIELYNIDGEVINYAYIDLDNLNKIVGHRIGITTGGYARIQIGNKRMFLHNYLFPELEMIDHINRNKLDNRRKNLRPIDKQNNAYNIDKGLYKGVRRVPSGRWVVNICVNYKTIYLGIFDTKEEALYHRYLADLQYCKDTRDKKYDDEKFKIFKENKFI
jgi:hypothetical protein